MNALLPYSVLNHRLILSAERLLFWEKENTLIVSDLHLGKTGHFRKAGIALPQSVYKRDLQRLIAQLYFFKADRLIIVGDMTHSLFNKELDLFKKWRHDFSMLDIQLVKGNHDILDEQWYQDCAITTTESELRVGDFIFRHDLAKGKTTYTKDAYTFCGHVHPGITVRGKGKQSLHFPCFYFTAHYSILPAFSHFTGTYPVDPQKDDMVFAIAENSIMPIG